VSNTIEEALSFSAQVLSREQVINKIESHIGSLRDHVGGYPGAWDPLNGSAYVKWERLVFVWIGRVTASLEAFSMVGMISPEQHARLHAEAMGVVNHAIADFIATGGRR